MATRAICSVSGCDKTHLAHTYCERHYRRFKKHGDPEGGGTAQGELPRWIDAVALRHTGDDCLIWPFGRHKDGYAQGRYPGLTTGRAYRAICELAHGAPPTPEHEAAHTCGQGRAGCVAPGHLTWKTKQDNEADKAEHGTIMKGSGHTNAKLTEADVVVIRGLLGTMAHKDIAARFNVSRPTVTMIATGATWAWLEADGEPG